MASLNRVTIIGNLGKDPEVRMIPSGKKVANFSVGITERFKDRNGVQQEKTEWVNVVFWEKLAEIAEQYLRKGSSVYVEGKLETKSWDDQNGQKRYKTEVRGMSLQMLGGKPTNQAPIVGIDQGAPGGDYSPGFPKDPNDDLPF